MATKKENGITDSERIGALMGNAIESMIFPISLLKLRDAYLESIYKSVIKTQRETMAEYYFDSYARAGRIRDIRFDDPGEEEIIKNPNPQPNTVDLYWSKQTKWAKAVISGGLVAALDRGDDYNEALTTLVLNLYTEKFKKGLNKIRARQDHVNW